MYVVRNIIQELLEAIVYLVGLDIKMDDMSPLGPAVQKN